MALLDVEDILMRFGGIVAPDNLSFITERGQTCGLIGPNGAPETTMVNGPAPGDRVAHRPNASLDHQRVALPGAARLVRRRHATTDTEVP